MTTRAAEPVITRARFEAAPSTLLSRGGWGNPDVRLVEIDDRQLVVKDFAPRSAWVRAGVGRFLIARERRIYQRLADHPNVPRLLPLEDDLAIALEYRAGVLLSRSLRGLLPPGFLEELASALSLMHEMGVVHLDLRHRSNVLAGEDGHPVLLDFASSLVLPPGSFRSRWLMPGLRRIDESALRKWQMRLGDPDGAASG